MSGEAAVRTVASTRARSSWPRWVMAAFWSSSSSSSAVARVGPVREVCIGLLGGAGWWSAGRVRSVIGPDEDRLQVLLRQRGRQVLPVDDVGDDFLGGDLAGGGEFEGV